MCTCTVPVRLEPTLYVYVQCTVHVYWILLSVLKIIGTNPTMYIHVHVYYSDVYVYVY